MLPILIHWAVTMAVVVILRRKGTDVEEEEGREGKERGI